MKNSTEDKLEEGYGICANNDPSEGNFAVFDDALSTMGPVSLARITGHGMSRYNKDMHSDLNLLFNGEKSESEQGVYPLGAFYKLPKKLQDSLIAIGKV